MPVRRAFFIDSMWEVYFPPPLRRWGLAPNIGGRERGGPSGRAFLLAFVVILVRLLFLSI